MKKLLTTVGILALLASGLAACSGSENSSSSANQRGEPAKAGSPTEISVLIGKSEIISQFEEMVEHYNTSQDQVKVSIISLGNQNAFDKMTTLYASNNAPTISMMGAEYESMHDKLLDLSDQPWVSHTMKGSLDYVRDGSQIKGMPVSVEAFGLIYNKKVLDQASGGNFDSATVKTQDELKSLMDKITSSGAAEGAIHVSPIDWSLGAHYTNILFADQSSDRDQRHKFIKDLKNGTVKLSENEIFSGWVNTFDLMKAYNINKSAPLSPVYDDGPIALATGQVGLWFMGNWAYPQILELDPEGQYGFLPVPISNNAEDYGNSQISVGVPSYWVVDAEQSTTDQQKAAKEFLNWMVSSKEGQDYYVNKLNFLPVFDNFTAEPADSLSQSVLSYMKSENTLEWMNTYYPADAYPAMGTSMQKYLADKINKSDLAKEFEAYWTKKKSN
ncbi:MULTISPECIES: ABC transporter substrate-binding protein [Paenibacillus]|uniref:ABC transporter substrate-binding protein n=1 Tax=Paenibacillus terrae TaxID=159743 RepID=A0A0D7WU46_9BACL|nr:ABC transporter substrate-binding protein [Paenibacillus terrae]KJD42695.1 ABC transporter substrate-binding protein [Paenibacillus terrae]